MKKSLTFQEIYEKSVEVVEMFRKVEKREWGAEGCMIELSKQIGELAKNVMVYENYYLPARDNDPRYQCTKEDIVHELADVLFIIIKLAHHYKVDLEKKYLDELEIAKNHPHMKIKPKHKNK